MKNGILKCATTNFSITHVSIQCNSTFVELDFPLILAHEVSHVRTILTIHIHSSNIRHN